MVQQYSSSGRVTSAELPLYYCKRLKAQGGSGFKPLLLSWHWHRMDKTTASNINSNHNKARLCMGLQCARIARKEGHCVIRPYLILGVHATRRKKTGQHRVLPTRLGAEETEWSTLTSRFCFEYTRPGNNAVSGHSIGMKGSMWNGTSLT